MRSSASTLTTAAALAGSGLEEEVLEQRAAMDRFLAGVERRAYRMAQLAVRDPDDALDIVQDAMFKLARHYSTSAPQEWTLLFFRILRNCVYDHQRRQTVRKRFLGWLPRPPEAKEDDDMLARVPGPASDAPDEQLAMREAILALEAAIGELPGRQREAFLLRTLEGLDVAATATVMGCSEGSVKTHLSRAMQSVRLRLGPHWDGYKDD
jgi:RNA polymerase sigma-70 factor (ECF subfamily)